MEIRIAAFAAGIVFGALVAGPASATLITGSYTGIIYDSYDETNVFGAGTGDDTVTGRAVSGTFSYVVEDVGPDLCPGVGACYQDYNGVNWLDISVTINGVTLTIQTTPTAGQNFQALYNHDFATGGEDFFSVYERDEQQAHDVAANDEIYRNDALLVRFHDYLSEFALGDGVPVSSFTWIDDDVSDFGDGAVQWFNYILDLDSNTYLSNNHAYANWNLLSLSLQGQAVQVPEPGTTALFAVGLLGIAWLSRRDRRTYAGARLTQASQEWVPWRAGFTRDGAARGVFGNHSGRCAEAADPESKSESHPRLDGMAARRDETGHRYALSVPYNLGGDHLFWVVSSRSIPNALTHTKLRRAHSPERDRASRRRLCERISCRSFPSRGAIRGSPPSCTTRPCHTHRF